MNAEQIADAVLKVVSEIGKAISGPAEQAFQILVKQYYNVGMLDLICAGIFLLLTIVCAVACIWAIIKVGITDDESPEATIGTIGFVGGIVCFIITLSCFCAGYLKLSNPAYYAILDMLNVIK